MAPPVYMSARILVLIPLALCLAVMIASNDAVIRALTVVPLALIIVLRDIIVLRELDSLKAEAKGRKK